ncbi:TetR/AcrR family transcriptional regulator [Aeromicrobium duanguangcaii]|uniref:TetR/AcrR family transcriptional regulator n=1 Tax=Aeromicrobium duanguangcaii TaxID=2968086 RepID=A0ABY5KEF3_9ACTN|nr:TetR/AcrR family transcriptional regulator [Aeromicrobium duanguangcaii]MCD9155186.1 TetR/AcrR family transcriptional regulator [Aeromicrobium duanguangcaii]MCL3838537.1 TetR/AcrR family transcriptional regulator [Aeromicrobium duanguangcaii]UUI68163.1 TetR/AcrR family transcriptional regulator [Aeromicrobium duanguangcaii]
MALRKLPRQQRSRDMVDGIVDAARDVLVADGYERLTTNRVADRAGVSPGSLYQYFPDKAAIVEEVTSRYVDRLAEDVVAALVDHVHDEPEAMARATAEALLTALQRDPTLLRVVWQDLPAARHLDDRLGLERRVRDVLRAYLGGRLSAQDRRRDPARASWLIVLAVESLAVRFVLDEDPPLTREEFVDDLVALGIAWL